MSCKNNSTNAYYTMLNKYGITKNENEDCFSLVTIPENAQGQVTQGQVTQEQQHKYVSFLTSTENTKTQLKDLERAADKSFLTTIVEKTEKSSESHTYINYCVIL
jgi:hypothetical protein